MCQILLSLAVIAALLVTTAQAKSAPYAIDSTRTFATFEIGHMGTSTNRGRLSVKEGIVQFDRAGKSGKVALAIDASSISTGAPGLQKHLQSPDFFNVAQFPTLKFEADNPAQPVGHDLGCQLRLPRCGAPRAAS